MAEKRYSYRPSQHTPYRAARVTRTPPSPLPPHVCLLAPLGPVVSKDPPKQGEVDERGTPGFSPRVRRIRAQLGRGDAVRAYSHRAPDTDSLAEVLCQDRERPIVS